MRTRFDKYAEKLRTAREKQLSEKTNKKNTRIRNIGGALFFLGLVLLLWEIEIYRDTIIDLKIPLLIWLTPGLVLTPIFYSRINALDRKANWALHYFLHTCMTGSFLLFSFMATNLYFSDSQSTIKHFNVINTGSICGPKGHRDEREPYVDINYEGLEKEVVFTYEETAKVMSAKSVKLTVRKGLLGFDILEKYEID